MVAVFSKTEQLALFGVYTDRMSTYCNRLQAELTNVILRTFADVCVVDDDLGWKNRISRYIAGFLHVCQVVFTFTFTFIFTFDRELKNTYAKSNPGNSSTTAWKLLRATEMYRHSSKNSPGIYWNLTWMSHRAQYLAVSFIFTLDREPNTLMRRAIRVSVQPLLGNH